MSIDKKLLFRRFVPTLLIGFVFLLVGAQNSYGQNIVGQILSRMDAHNKALSSLKANVTRVDFNDQLKSSDTRQGKVAYRPNGATPAIRIDWVSPEEILLVKDKKFQLVRTALKQVYQGSTDGKKRDSTPGGALAFMSMSRAQLKTNYDIAYIGEETVKSGVKTWHIQMTPKVRTSYKKADLWVDGNGMPVQSMITEHNNDTMTILLTNLDPNVTIPGSVFAVSTAGMKIIPA